MYKRKKKPGSVRHKLHSIHTRR